MAVAGDFSFKYAVTAKHCDLMHVIEIFLKGIIYVYHLSWNENVYFYPTTVDKNGLDTFPEPNLKLCELLESTSLSESFSGDILLTCCHIWVANSVGMLFRGSSCLVLFLSISKKAKRDVGVSIWIISQSKNKDCK